MFQVLKARNWEEKFPLFTTVHKIASDHLPPSAIVKHNHEAPNSNTKAPVYDSLRLALKLKLYYLPSIGFVQLFTGLEI